MKNTVTLTAKQAVQFRRMHSILVKISKDYQTPKQLCKDSENEYGVEYLEALEMSYENIQGEAKAAIKGIQIAKIFK
jgi:hypothetical protein